MAGVRLAEEFHETTEQAIEAEEQPEDHAWARQRLVAIGGNGKKYGHHDAFEGRLVELARVARGIAGSGKDHGPGHVAHAPHYLGVDEIGDAAEEQPERSS